MPWVVDTCVLIDVLEDDPEFGTPSAECLARLLSSGLVACPVTTIEVAPAFDGDQQAQKEFFALCGVRDDLDFTQADVRRAFAPWNAYVVAKRRHKSPAVAKRPVADMMIGAFACRFDGIITRNGSHFRPWFPELNIVNPTASRDI